MQTGVGRENNDKLYVDFWPNSNIDIEGSMVIIYYNIIRILVDNGV